MRLLWVVSQITPDMANIISKPQSVFGGWVQNMLNELKTNDELKIFVVGCDHIDSTVNRFIDGIHYYILPITGKNKLVSQETAKNLVNTIAPDIIHIEGTEFAISHCFSQIHNCPNILSLQGIIAGYEPYQWGRLPIEEMMFSFKNFLVGWGLFLRKNLLFDGRINIEIETLQNADNLLGRTLWDRAHSYKYNNKASYYACPRILRNSFYDKQWQYDKCQKYSIFVGNGYSALKGAHTVIEAVAQLRNEFPNIHLNIAGTAPFDSKLGYKTKIGYAPYIKKQLKKYNLENHVSYTGPLQASKMTEAMLQSHVYVLPSLIENSPNTLGEAMLLGVPVVTAYTGGVPTMVVDNEEALFYRAGDPTMLAWQIKQVFDNIEAAISRAKKAREHALKTHDSKKNKNIMIDVYKDILNKGNTK